MLSIRQISGPFGAEISGFDVTSAAFDASLDQVKTALCNHHFLCFRDQSLNKESFAVFGAKFGDLETAYVSTETDGKIHSPVHYVTNLDKDGKPAATPHNNRNLFWHTDRAYHRLPAYLTMLFAVEVPPTGGDTEFADMTAAYEALPDDTKRRIDPLLVTHSHEYVHVTLSGIMPTEEQRRKAPPVKHPLVRVDPETGKKSLYLGMYCCEIDGMPTAEARALIKQLQDHSTHPRFIHTHKWRPGDLIFWDNRCLMHRATTTYDMNVHRRILLRVVTRGTAPVGPMNKPVGAEVTA